MMLNFKTMRIAMIGQKGIPAIYGGIERHVEELSRELVKQGHEVLVYARGWYSTVVVAKYQGIKIVHTPTLHTKHLDAITHTFISTLHAIFKEKPQVIHFHGVGPAVLSFLPRLLSPKTKVVATFHCIDRYHQKWGVFARLMLAVGERAACLFPHQTISVSRTIQNYCLNEYQKITAYIPNGVIAPVGNSNPAALGEFGLEANKYILMVSRLVRHKGAHYLLHAWQFAKQQYPELFRDTKLAIVGDSAFTDDYLHELKAIARGDNSIVFTGWQHGRILDELYANAGLFVHPSENEGLPITVLQAMSCGRPVLVSDIPEHQEVILDKRFWFQNASIVSLSDKLVELLKDKTALEIAGAQNKETVIAKYHWTDIARETQKLYGSPLSQKIKIKPLVLKEKLQ